MGYEFFEGKVIFLSALVSGINNDQSLNDCQLQCVLLLTCRHVISRA